MDDKELLEFAAKAAGYEVLAYDEQTDELACRCPARGTFIWAPRKDDGDALRLAVQLRMEVFSSRLVQGASVRGEDMRMITRVCLRKNDPCAATRRAIVCAAAAIEREKRDRQTQREERAAAFLEAALAKGERGCTVLVRREKKNWNASGSQRSAKNCGSNAGQKNSACTICST